MGLPVHDGQGNLIVFMPINVKKQGKLPGKKFTLSFYDKNGKLAGNIGDDFAIRVINPEKDLAKVDGDEEWFWSLEEDSPKVPNSVIDTIILNKDHKITLDTLGKKLDSFSDGGTDADGLSKLYGVVLSGNIDKSARRIFDTYKTSFIKDGYDRALWNQVDKMFRDFDDQEDSEKITDIFLNSPFIVQGDETKEAFAKRVLANKNIVGPIAERIGSSLVNGIPSQDKDKNVLQFKDGFEIKSTTEVKPLSALALIDLYMETEGEWDDMVFTKKDLNEKFDWMLVEGSNAFDGKQIWMLDSNPLQTNGVEDEASLDEEAEENKRIIIELVKTITGVDKIGVERKYNDMVKSFHSIIKKIEHKHEENKSESFGNSFRGDMVQFGAGEMRQDATAEFSVVNFDNQPVDNLNLLLVPMFENITNYTWVPMLDQAVSAEFINGKYIANDLKVVNPDFRFDENGEVNEDGNFKTTGQYDIWVIDGDDRFPITTFPIFPGENRLDRPFFYDNTIDYGVVMPEIHTGGMGGSMESGGSGTKPPVDIQFESYFLDESRDLFIPFIVKTNSERVGENILHYDAVTKKFTFAEKRGVIQDATITMTIINKDYNTQSTPISVTEMTIGNEIDEGAMVTIMLEGSQIETQSIDMILTYVGGDGIAVDFVGQSNMQDGDNMMEMVRDRFHRERNFVAEFNNGQRINGSATVLEFTDREMILDGVHYVYMFDDFESVTMMKKSDSIVDVPEYVTFRFAKEQIRNKVDVTMAMMSGKELLLDDNNIARKFVFNSDGRMRQVVRDKIFRSEANKDPLIGEWSIEDGKVLIKTPMYEDMSLVVISDEDGVLNEDDKMILAFVEGDTIHPASPEQNVAYFGEPRDDESSFSYIVYPDNSETGNGSTSGGNVTPPPSEEYLPLADVDMIELLAGQSFYSVYPENDHIVIEKISFNDDLTTISFEGIEGSSESGTDDITIDGSSIVDSDGNHTIVDIQDDFILIQDINDDGNPEISPLFRTLELARKAMDDIIQHLN
jgi:hypothetical protein